MELNKRLNEEMERIMLAMENTPMTDPAYTQLASRLDQLSSLCNDLKRQEAEHQEKLAEQRQRRREFWVRAGIDVGIALGTAGIYLLGVRWGYWFEEKGSISSATLRRVLSEGRLKKIG